MFVQTKHTDMREKINYTFKEEDDYGYYSNGKYHKGYVNKMGYNIFCPIDENGGKKWCYVHIAKWIYFNGEIPEGLEVDHIIPVRNGGTNKLSNLRLVSHKGNMNNQVTLNNLSKWVRTEETRKKMSESGKGKHKNLATKTVYQYTLDGILVKKWLSAVEAKSEGYSATCISQCCNNQRKTHKGYRWSFQPL